jgi:probable HAF family extracellular repeat protein
MKRQHVALAALWLALAACRQANAEYVFTTLDVPGSIATYTETANGINAFGQIVGTYFNSGSGEHGFLYSGGNYLTIDVPGSGNSYTHANGINDSVQIVGHYSGSGKVYGFLYDGGSYTTLNVPGSIQTIASGINNAGQVVGLYADSSNRNHGYLYSGGAYTTLNVPGSIDTEARGINNSGQIVGYYEDAVHRLHGFLYANGHYNTLDAPGGNRTFGLGLNDDDDVVGYFTNASSFDGFLYRDGRYTTDWPDSPFDVVLAGGINNSGQIVGSYGNHGFLATPIPEPATLTLLAIGIAGLAFYGWRRRKQPA